MRLNRPAANRHLADAPDPGQTLQMILRTPLLVAGLLAAAGLASAQQHQPPPGGHQPPDHMQHRFDDPEQWAKEFDDPARDAWQLPAKVVEALKLQPGQAVADIGAGTGYFSAKLAKSPAAPTVYAVDIEPAMVAHLTTRAAKEGLKNLVAVQAGPDGPNLPVPVDTVLIVDTFHHIPDRVAYFTRLRRSIKPGGQLVIVDFRKDAPSGPPVEFRFMPDQITSELSRAGFTLAAQHDFLPRQHLLVYRETIR
jgi:ubiquinone/menaquinone biosynthesis C-methylase UbiE